MALNSSHAGKGVLLYSGECIILFCDNVTMEFGGSLPDIMKGSKTGRLYLTTHRMIFNNKNAKDPLQSFATPFFCLKKVELEQPVFGANYIKGYVKAQSNGGFSGEAKFKLTFKHATQNVNQAWREAPPPYTPPTCPYNYAPPPAYAPPQAGYYGWVPPTTTFPERPPNDGVYMYEAPPPYPGLSPQGAYPPQSNGYAPPAGYPGNQGPGAIGFSIPDSHPKAQEANQSAYYDPNNPQYAYVPPPAYSPTAPSYNDVNKKTD
ncbi:WW domain-binding protein 2 [Armadillidium nasatum]|uniref:WW domain-binding protein 2 n=1 Tax=Armadillidium nasatum TaxID=96803 RepID=A0A5N5T3H5_9CRUS|nr:WW domain-binding protein 2 [Armadillidium nasatum]